MPELGPPTGLAFSAPPPAAPAQQSHPAHRRLGHSNQHSEIPFSGPVATSDSEFELQGWKTRSHRLPHLHHRLPPEIGKSLCFCCSSRSVTLSVLSLSLHVAPRFFLLLVRFLPLLRSSPCHGCAPVSHAPHQVSHPGSLAPYSGGLRSSPCFPGALARPNREIAGQVCLDPMGNRDHQECHFSTPPRRSPARCPREQCFAAA
mmetsp:Transcript_131397/g.238996  ORF Transcript_131397/g.238996 Transcript_131397/m.238996 type:complete len:203 (+) Transcript_131397:111-719(+)